MGALGQQPLSSQKVCHFSSCCPSKLSLLTGGLGLTNESRKRDLEVKRLDSTFKTVEAKSNPAPLGAQLGLPGTHCVPSPEVSPAGFPALPELQAGPPSLG